MIGKSWHDRQARFLVRGGRRASGVTRYVWPVHLHWAWVLAWHGEKYELKLHQVFGCVDGASVLGPGC